MLVGVNNAGKSTILQGIKACYSFVTELIRERNVLNDDASRAAINISYLNLPDIRDAWHNHRQRKDRVTDIPVIFIIEFTNNIKFEIHLRQFFGQPHIKIRNSLRDISKDEVLEILRGNPILVPGFVGALVNEEQRTPQSINRTVAAGRHTEVLRNVLLQLKKEYPERFQTLDAVVTKYFNVKLSKVSFDETTDEYVTTLFDDDDVELDVGLAGSGFLQVLQLLTFILSKKSNIVLLDEPDAHLHPSLQKTLIEILTELGKNENIQFVISTHSKEVVAQSNPRDVIYIDNNDKQGKRLTSVPELIDVIGKLGYLDRIDLALLLQTKRCLFVEGDDHKLLHYFANKLGYPIFQGNKQVITIPRNGGDNYRYYDDLTVFSNFVGAELKAYSIIDRDLKTDEIIDEIIRKAKERNVITHVWKKHEIENYLINPHLLQRLVNEKLKKMGVATEVTNIDDLIRSCAEELRQDVEDKLSGQIVDWTRRKGEKIGVPEANKQAREIIASRWNTLDDIIGVVPGKELLSRFNGQIQALYGVTVGVHEITSQMTNEEIGEEISTVLRAIMDM